jgi:hypothetical protein
MASDSLGAPIAAAPINLPGVSSAPAPASPAEPSLLLDSAVLDALRDRITAIKNSHKLLEAELAALPEDDQQQFFRQRQRPRQSTKPLVIHG